MNTILLKQVHLPQNMTNSSEVTSCSTASGDLPDASLTPEMLLAYCASRLSAVDATVGTFFAEQKRISKEAKEISAALEVAGRCKGGEINPVELQTFSGGSFKFNEEAAKEWAGMANEQLDNWRSSSSPEAKKIAAEEFKLRTGRNIEEFAQKDQKVTVNDIKKASEEGKIKTVSRMDADTRLQGYKEKLTGLTKDGELNMIQLQSVISQRQLAVQLTTQLMQTLHETLKGIVGNVRSS